MPRAAPHVPAGYLELVRSNKSFRLLWLGSIVSLLGDWFNTIAIYTLVERLTSSPLAMGAVFVTKMGAFAVASPLAGVIADRYDRRRLLIGTDLARAVIVLGFLLVAEASDLALLYTLTASQIALGAVFTPAKKASIPNITSDRELITANALSAATWSALLAIGAALGGFATAWLGTDLVFVIDSATYLVSAALIAGATIPQQTRRPTGSLFRTAHTELVAGWRYLRDHPRVLQVALAKPAWAVGGGALVFLLTQVAEEMALGFAISVGVLFSARGLGTGLGPIVARAAFRDERKWPRILGACILVSGLGYLIVGLAGWTLWILPLIVLAHAASGANWVLSTVLLQKRTEDAFRGRVFATEWLGLTLVDAVGIGIASLLLEAPLVDLRTLLMVAAALQIATGAAWLAWMAAAEARPVPDQP